MFSEATKHHSFGVLCPLRSWVNVCYFLGNQGECLFGVYPMNDSAFSSVWLCDVIYHIPPKKCDLTNSCILNCHMEKLESLYYSAAQAITGAWKGTSKTKVLEELGWETLDKQRWSRCLILLYKIINKIINNITPAYTWAPIPNRQEPFYSCRARTVIGEICARTDKYKSSFYPNCLSEWENGDLEIRNAASLAIIKAKISRIICTTPKQVYGIHNHKRLETLTQLRVGLSELNYYKFRHNFNTTINSLCPINGGAEDMEHSLLHCHFYQLQRNSLLSSIQSVLLSCGLSNLSNVDLVSILVYGDERLNFESNKIIIKATLDFIESSKRFS